MIDTENFVLLVKELRQCIGREKIISLAVSSSTIIAPELNNQSLLQASVSPEMDRYVDMINVMAYVSHSQSRGSIARDGITDRTTWV